MAVTAENRVGQIKPARGLMEIVDFATRSHARAAVVLVVVALLSILPGFFAIPPTDRDESRFAQATKQMLETGDFIDIRFQETTRYKKPVGIYWLQAGVVKTAQWLGMRNAITTIWLYRIPSLLGAIGAVLLTYWAALAFLSRRAAVLAGSDDGDLPPAQRRGADRQDRRLRCLFTAVAAMGAMARAYLPEQRAQLEGTSAWTVPAIFWTALAASVLLKGPVIPMIVFLTVVTLVVVDRSLKWILALRPLVGVVWFLVLVLPWFVAITMRAGDGFFAESVGQDLFSKLFQGQESHGAPPGYYLLLFWVTFWPGATLAGMVGAGGVRGAPRARREIPARLDRAGLDRVRARGDQAAALCAAALSRDRDPDCRRRGRARAARQELAGAGDDLVVHRAGVDRPDRARWA